MEKQKYDYKFFMENYPYRYDSIFKKYYKQQEKKYRYFISINKDINSHSNYGIYRSNETLEKIFSELKNVDFEVAKIVDHSSKFPEPREYIYNKFQLRNSWITEEYYLRNRFTGRRNRTSDTWVYKIWNDKKYIYSCIADDNYISIYYDGIDVRKYKDNDIEVNKYVAFSESIRLKFDSDVIDKLKVIIKRIQQDNINGFYDDMIEKIKNNFGIN